MSCYNWSNFAFHKSAPIYQFLSQPLIVDRSKFHCHQFLLHISRKSRRTNPNDEVLILSNLFLFSWYQNLLIAVLTEFYKVNNSCNNLEITRKQTFGELFRYSSFYEVQMWNTTAALLISCYHINPFRIICLVLTFVSIIQTDIKPHLITFLKIIMVNC